MFGYIRPHTPELKVREQEYYRGIYCGLCRAMGRCTGCLSCFTLSYDFVYLALVRMAAVGEKPTFTPRRCAAHPTRRRPMADASATLDDCARAAALLTYRKLRDDVEDERGGRRLRARLLLPAAGQMRRRALRVPAEQTLDDAISDALAELAALERERTPSVDLPADAFGRLMQALAAHGLTGSAARITGELGFHLGRWLYVADALDDYTEDIRLGRYNPFAAARGEEPLSETARGELAHAMTAELMRVEAALDLLDLDDNPDAAGILRNILYLGMPRAAKAALTDHHNDNGDENERSL